MSEVSCYLSWSFSFSFYWSFCWRSCHDILSFTPIETWNHHNHTRYGIIWGHSRSLQDRRRCTELWLVNAPPLWSIILISTHWLAMFNRTPALHKNGNKRNRQVSSSAQYRVHRSFQHGLTTQKLNFRCIIHVANSKIRYNLNHRYQRIILSFYDWLGKTSIDKAGRSLRGGTSTKSSSTQNPGGFRKKADTASSFGILHR